MRRWLPVAMMLPLLVAACAAPRQVAVRHVPTTLNRLESSADVTMTVAALREAFAARGIKVFTVIDHAAAARASGLAMPPTEVIVFGNPKAGTPLMQSHPDLALDLPLRLLVRQGAGGHTEVLWHPAAAIEAHAGVPAGGLAPLAAVDGLIRSTVLALSAN